MASHLALDAQPHAVEIDPQHCAVIVVDMQNDFVSPGGMFESRGVDISAVRQTISPTKQVLAAARSAGMKIVYLKMAYRPDLSDLGAEGSVNRTRHLYFGVGQPCTAPDGRAGRYLIRDSWNTDIIEELTPRHADVLIYKHRFSGFFETELDSVLRKHGVADLVFTGCTTCICVDSTLRDAMFRDYRCVLLSDCSAEPIGNNNERSNHEASLLNVQTLLGWVSDSGRFLSAVKNREETAVRTAS